MLILLCRPQLWLATIAFVPQLLFAQMPPSTTNVPEPRPDSAAPHWKPNSNLQAFQAYQPWRAADRPDAWQALNQDVKNRGGWRAYQFEATQPLQNPTSEVPKP